MPLSEEELRLLEQMERALVEEDPKFASTLRGTSFRRAARRRAVLAGVAFAAGITVLMAGAIMEIIAVGILGFVIMLGSATYGLAVIRGHAAPTPAVHAEATERTSHGFPDSHGVRRPRKPRGSGSFMERMESRWRKRRDDGSSF